MRRLSITAEDVYEYVKSNLDKPICALCFEDSSGKRTYHDTSGAVMPRTVEGIKSKLVMFDEARIALSYHTDRGAKIAYYHPSNKWLVVGDGLNPKVLEAAKFAIYTPFTNTESPLFN